MVSSFQLSPSSLIIPSINESFSDVDFSDINSNDYDQNDEFISYEELMDFLPSNEDNNQLISKQDYQNNDQVKFNLI